MRFGQKINRLSGYFRAIDEGTTQEYHDKQDKRKERMKNEGNEERYNR